MSRAAPTRRPDTEPPLEENAAVEIDRLEDSDDAQMGVVVAINSFDDYDAPRRVIARVKAPDTADDDRTQVNVSEQQVRVVSGTEADLVQDIIGLPEGNDV